MYSSKPITGESIVLLGDSLTEGFDLDYFYPEKGLINRGISGDTTLQVYFRIEEIVNAKPKALFLMIGINDLFHDVSPEEVTTNIINILTRFSGDTQIFLQSILPVNETICWTLMSETGSWRGIAISPPWGSRLSKTS